MEKVTLKEFLATIMDERFKAHQALHDTADSVLDARLARLNELRELVQDIRSGVVTREYYDVEHAALKTQVGLAQDRIGAVEGRFLGIGIAATALGAAGVVVGLVR